MLGPLLGGTPSRTVSVTTTSQSANRPQPEATTSGGKATKAPQTVAAEPPGKGTGRPSERDGVIRKVPNFPSAVIRSRPKSKAGIQDGLRPGHRVSVVDRRGAWLQVEYENRAGKTQRGWTHEVNVTVP